jgi:hypothetical protein
MPPMVVYQRTLCTLGLGLLVVAAPACKQKTETGAAASDTSTAASAPAPAAFAVTSVDVGKQVGPDKRVAAPSTTFAPNDTIYASVTTEGAAPSKTVVAKWTFGTAGKLVKADSQTIAPKGPATTEFHISKPSGWPAGKYQVEISVDGSPAGSKAFEVKK